MGGGYFPPCVPSVMSTASIPSVYRLSGLTPMTQSFPALLPWAPQRAHFPSSDQSKPCAGNGRTVGESKTSTTSSEPNSKQTFKNTGQERGCWPGPYLGFLENVPRAQQSGAYQGKPHQATHFPTFIQSGASTTPDVVYLSPMCDQTHILCNW